MANNNHKRLLPFWIYIVFIIVLSCIALSLALNYFDINYSCVGYSTNNISSQHYDYAERAIEITDLYLDYEISAKSASILMDELTARDNELPNTSQHKDTLIESDVSMLSGSLMLADFETSSEQYNEILSIRNRLAKRIGNDER